jgi:hypothetical protein
VLGSALDCSMLRSSLIGLVGRISSAPDGSMMLGSARSAAQRLACRSVALAAQCSARRPMARRVDQRLTARCVAPYSNAQHSAHCPVARVARYSTRVAQYSTRCPSTQQLDHRLIARRLVPRPTRYSARIGSSLPFYLIKMSKTHYMLESKTIWTEVTENHVKGKCLPSQPNKVTGPWQWQPSLAISGHGSSPLGSAAYGNALITTLTHITAAMRAAFITTSTHIPAAMRAMVMLPLFYSESEDVFPVVSEMRCKFGSKTISTNVCIPGPEAMPLPWAMQPGVALVVAAATASPAFDRLQRLLN